MAFGLTAASFFAIRLIAQSVPPLVNYQGRLTDQTGAPVAGGFYTIQFRIWNDPVAAAPTNLVWSQQQIVTVQSTGAFDVLLGSTNGNNISATSLSGTNIAYAFGSPSAFLGVTVTVSNGTTVGGATEILPRQQLLSVPFTIQAQQAQQSQVAQTLAQSAANILSPPGSIIAYMGTNAPPGWLLCDGSAVGRTNYAALFSVIGTTSGSADGVTNFNLPDLRGMFLRGVNAARTDAFADPDAAARISVYPGGNASNAVGSVQADIFANHVHSITVDRDPGGQWRDNISGGNYPQNEGPVNPYQNNTGGSSQGGSETRPKNVYVNFIIKY